mgnify:CR=1 FL=1
MEDNNIDEPDKEKVPAVGGISDAELEAAVQELIGGIADDAETHPPEARETSDSDMALVNVCSEFLDSFAIIGYNFDGEPLCLSTAPTIQKREALDALTMRYIKHLK